MRQASSGAIEEVEAALEVEGNATGVEARRAGRGRGVRAARSTGYLRALERGVCVRCRVQRGADGDDDVGVVCVRCRGRIRERERAHVQWRREIGVCIRCEAEELRAGTDRCERCWERERLVDLRRRGKRD